MKNLVCLMGVAALLALVPAANASLVINYEFGAGPVLTCANGADDGPVICSFSGGGVNASIVSASSNSPGSLYNSEQFGSNLNVTSSANATVKIWFSAQDFALPVFGEYEGSLSTTSTSANTTSTAMLTNCIDTTNGIAPSLGCAGGQIVNTTETLMGAGSKADTQFLNVPGPLTTPYSLEQQITLSLTPGSDFNVITSQSLTAVPEPAEGVLLATVLGALALLRKKFARS